MINFTTPTITLRVNKVDVTPYKVFVSIKQNPRSVTKFGDDLTMSTETVGQYTNTIITFSLTQRESAKFDFHKDARVQVNWIDSNGVRGATKTKEISVMENLLDKELSYDD